MTTPSSSNDLPENTVQLVGKLIDIAGENPEAKQAGRELGKTALTVTQTINVVLLPLAALNSGIEKARKYFANPFAEELAAKADAIPSEFIVEPKASVAGPALQGLAFTHEEPNLKEMFLSLLVTAMDGRKANNAHPAFVEIIKQLTSEEAILLRGIVQSNVLLPIVELREKAPGTNGHHVSYRHLMSLVDDEVGEHKEDLRLPAKIDNWIRLGLIEVTYEASLVNDDSYKWVEQRPEYRRCCEESAAVGSEGLQVEKA